MSQSRTVVRDHIRAAGALDYVYELGERMGVFQLADTVVMNWSSGAIAVVPSNTATQLHEYWKLRDERITPHERRILYKRVLNKGSAELDQIPVNREFTRAHRRLLEEVTIYIERLEQPGSGSGATSLASRRGVYQAARELQYNLSEFCTGVALAQIPKLYAQLEEAMAILASPEILAHYDGSGHRNVWSLIEILAKAEFGVAPNVAALRSLAVNGNRILQWVAGSDEGTSTTAEFQRLVEAAESYILNASLDVDQAGAGMCADDESSAESDSGLDKDC